MTTTQLDQQRADMMEALYQRSEKPVKIPSCRVLLKEKTTKKASGAYKNK